MAKKPLCDSCQKGRETIHEGERFVEVVYNHNNNAIELVFDDHTQVISEQWRNDLREQSKVKRAAMEAK